ncbi:hypothetical protein [Curvibacter delicatus]|jgi:hypothetical protein|uniref:hypothetical protein n=1 Tax=Curvibacter delicatus TaxID=80879 RepID=UPI000AFA3B13|nr:hypothetical protein [Curvibacter delicatus]
MRIGRIDAEHFNDAASHDNSFAEAINAIRALMAQPKPANRRIGFTADLNDKQCK